MHRSGTSALGGVLAKLGAQSPATLMPPTQDNPKGYWESVALMGLHDRLLASAGSDWDDWERFNPVWLETPVADRFESELAEAIGGEYGDAPLLLVKDPRISRFVPLWDRTLRKLDIEPRALLCLRHPIEVAQSLQRRDRFGRRRALLIWLRHMLDAEHSTRDMKRVVVPYAGLLADWRGQVARIANQLDVKWPRWSGKVEVEIDDFLSAELHRNRAGQTPEPEGDALDTWVGGCFRAIEALSGDSDDVRDAQAELDLIRAEFDASTRTYGAVLREMERLHHAAFSALENEAEGRISTLSGDMEQAHRDHVRDVEHLRRQAEQASGQLQQANERLENAVAEHADNVEHLQRLIAQANAGMESAKLEHADELQRQRQTSEQQLERQRQTSVQQLERQRQESALHLERQRQESALHLERQRQESALHLERQQQASVKDLEQVRDQSRAHEANVAALREELRERTAAMAARSDRQSKRIVAAEREGLRLAKAASTALLANGRLQLENSLLQAEHDEQRRVLGSLYQDYLALAGSKSQLLRALVRKPQLRTTVGDPGNPVLVDAEEVRRSGLFDSAWYIRNQEDITARGIDPLIHYVQFGAAEGRPASADLAAVDASADNGTGETTRPASANPLLDAVRIGGWNLPATRPRKRVDPLRHLKQIAGSDLFDHQWYLRQYPAVADSGIEPATHYLLAGAQMLYDPGPDFSTAFYLRRYRDVARAGINPLAHYLAHGRKEGRETRRSVHPLTYNPGPSRAQLSSIKAGPPRISSTQLQEVIDAFDPGFYALGNPDLPLDVGLFEHYMTQGWQQALDPTPEFSTGFYLRAAPDVARGGINPFTHYVLHGRRENRRALPLEQLLKQREYRPLVTVVVPNFNHARFLRQRIDSILSQSYGNIEVLLLDDCSTDDSRTILEDYASRHPQRVRTLFNTENSGNLFRQWRKGVEAARGELVWICESDDFCEPDFLAHLVPQLQDRSVQIAFGRIQFCHADGSFRPGLDGYREGAEAGIWDAPLVRPASEWFRNGFGVNNVIANVGGCIFRRQALSANVWKEASTFSVLGDWFLYCHLAGPGQIAFHPQAVAYFRQHGNNTSVTAFKGRSFYDEHQRLMQLLRSRWEVPEETVVRFIEKVRFQYDRFGLQERHGPFEELVNLPALMRVTREQPHIMLGTLGFIAGGGEIFPLHLANALRKQGQLVSMLAYDTVGANPEIMDQLDPGIPVYDSRIAVGAGVPQFMAATGASLVHSHMVIIESLLLGEETFPTGLAYLVTMHGSYEACEIPTLRVRQFAKHVDRWVYTAERNLEPLQGVDVPATALTKLHNGMPVDEAPFPSTREDLGIAEDAVVFAFVARGVAGKGWDVATAAFTALRAAHPGRPLHLLMCGTGTETDRQLALHGSDPDITFLGYQSRITGLYRLSDCAIVPTRYAGESFPLCIIQAMQAGTPVIATRIGEIGEILAPARSAPCGLLIDNDADTDAFVASLRAAMEAALDPALRHELGAAATATGSKYDITQVAAEYGSLYGQLLANSGKSLPADVLAKPVAGGLAEATER